MLNLDSFLTEQPISTYFHFFLEIRRKTQCFNHMVDEGFNVSLWKRLKEFKKAEYVVTLDNTEERVKSSE